MKLNVKQPIYTYEGAKAAHINAEQQLRRSVLSCLLWESEFYEDGQTIADRIIDTAKKVSKEKVNALCIEARQEYKLRHVPLLLATVYPDKETISSVIQRADELTELLAIYWRNGKKPIPAQMKKGLADAFKKFDAYQLAKYNRPGAIKLRDVLFMVHAKPDNAEQEYIWKKLVDGTLESPDTWEVALSGGGNKTETFTRLLKEGKLGYMALLRNLRNMEDVDPSLVKQAILDRKGAGRVLPFRFIAASRYAPRFERELDEAMQWSANKLPRLSGKTVVLVDVSASMSACLSRKSDMTRLDAAAALGAIVQGDDVRVFSFSEKVVEIPPRQGMAGVDAIKNSQLNECTYLKRALQAINNQVNYDRIIVITDEQSHDGHCAPRQGAKGYLINVASNKNGIGYGVWTHIDGFSENVLRFINEAEK